MNVIFHILEIFLSSTLTRTCIKFLDTQISARVKFSEETVVGMGFLQVSSRYYYYYIWQSRSPLNSSQVYINDQTIRNSSILLEKPKLPQLYLRFSILPDNTAIQVDFNYT
jgi:hypothetical protein